MANFAGAMIDLEKVQAFTDNNFVVFREAGTFLKKYLQMEEEMLRNLQKLCRATIDASRVSESSSVHSNWEKILQSIETSSRERAEQISRTHNVENTLNEQRKNIEGNIKVLKTDAEKFHKDLQNWHATEAKNKTKYHQVYSEWEQTVMQMEKDLNSHRKATGFSKVQDKMDSLAKKTSQAKADLQTTVNCLNDYQKQYYTVHVPGLLKRHEELNGYMGQTLTLSLKGYSDLLHDLEAKGSKYCNDITTYSSQVNFINDMKNFVQAHGKPNFQPPPPVTFDELNMSDGVRKVIDDSKPASKRVNTDEVAAVPHKPMNFNNAVLPESDSPDVSRKPSILQLPSRSNQAKPPAVSSPVGTNPIPPNSPPSTRSTPARSTPTLPQVPPSNAKPQLQALSPKPGRRALNVQMAKALYDCDASGADELAFKEGDMMEILESQGNWWKAKDQSGKIGLVPNNYMEIIPSSQESDSPPEPVPPPRSRMGSVNPVTSVPTPRQRLAAQQGAIVCDPSVPMLVQRCIESLLNKSSLETEGIFRIPGNLKEMKDLKTRFEREGDVDLSVCRDPLTVAGLLKLYFRESTSFPVNKDMIKSIIEIWNYPDVEEKKAAFGALLADLPPSNFHTLHALFQLLLRVVQYEDDNKMNPNNLSKVFGLSLFHDLTPGTANSVVEFWMVHFAFIFSPPSFPQFI